MVEISPSNGFCDEPGGSLNQPCLPRCTGQFILSSFQILQGWDPQKYGKISGGHGLENSILYLL